jgi:hypothetical protein
MNELEYMKVWNKCRELNISKNLTDKIIDIVDFTNGEISINHAIDIVLENDKLDKAYEYSKNQ